MALTLTLLATPDTQIIRVVEALYNQTPGYTYLANFRTFTTDNGIDGFANAMAASFASSTDAALAATVTANLGLTGDALSAGNAYLEAQFAAAPAARGKAVLDAMNALATLESDATYGAAATAFNADVVASTSYSIVTTNTAALAAGAGQSYSLSTATDNLTGTAGDDTFNAAAPAAATQTLASSDSIDGGAGTDTLNATIANASTYGLSGLSNVENLSANFSDAGTITMQGATGVTSITNNASTAAAVVTAIDSAATALTVSNTGENTTFDIANAALAGSSDNVSVTVSGVTGAATVNVAPVSGTEGSETITLNSTGSANSITLDIDTATDLTALTVTGDQNLTLVTAPTTIATIDASAMTGALTHTITKTAAVTLTGGAGNDAITAEATTGSSDSISTGAGNDKVTYAANLAVTDTLDGGDGTDTLESTSALFAAYTAPATKTISNFEKLELSDALGAGISTADIQANISTVDLDSGAGTFALTMEAGTRTVEIGASNAGHLTVNDTGTATTDTLNVTNTGAADDMFDTNNLVIAGFETVNLTTSGTGAATSQDAGTIGVTADTGGTATLNVIGSNTLTTTGSITAAVIDASGLTGTAILDMGAAATSVTSIIGGAGNDDLRGDASSNIDGGAGNDAVVGGSGNDTLSGGDGVDSITSAAGNDSIDAGAGNDTITMAGNLATGDVVNGGDGTDTLSITSAGTLAALDDYSISASTNLNGNISNIERVKVTDAFNTGQAFDMARLDSIAFVDLEGGHTGDEELSGLAADSTVVIGAASTGALTLGLGTATGSTDSVTVTLDASANADYGSITTSAIETINIVATETTASTTERVATIGASLTTATTVNFSGLESVTLDTAVAAATVDASGLTLGNFIMSATASGLSQAITGSLVGADTIYGGGGVDTIITAGGGDSIVGGTGADVITSGTGADTIDGGAGNDTITLTEAAASSDQVTLGWSESGAHIDTVVGFTVGSTGTDVIALDVSELSKVTASGGIDANATIVTDLFDGNDAGTTDGVQVITTASKTAADGKNIFVLQSSVIGSTNELEDALESGGSYALTISANDAHTVQHDSFFAVYSDGTDSYVASVRIETDASNNAVFATGGLEAENLVKISGVSSIGATTFVAGNFDFV